MYTYIRSWHRQTRPLARRSSHGRQNHNCPY